MDEKSLRKQNGLIAAGLGAVAMTILIGRSVIFPPPAISIAAANGTYVNECCEHITLRDGTMYIGDREISYDIGEDKEGAFILPAGYVGVGAMRHLRIERRSMPLKLRLNNRDHPEQISIYGVDRSYSFERTSAGAALR